jgi:hypothetical protein
LQEPKNLPHKHILRLVTQYQWLEPVILATQEAEIRKITVQSQLRQVVLETLSQKNPSQKRAGRIVGARLPNKHKSLSSNISAAKKKRL